MHKYNGFRNFFFKSSFLAKLYRFTLVEIMYGVACKFFEQYLLVMPKFLLTSLSTPLDTCFKYITWALIYAGFKLSL